MIFHIFVLLLNIGQITQPGRDSAFLRAWITVHANILISSFSLPVCNPIDILKFDSEINNTECAGADIKTFSDKRQAHIKAICLDIEVRISFMK